MELASVSLFQSLHLSSRGFHRIEITITATVIHVPTTQVAIASFQLAGLFSVCLGVRVYTCSNTGFFFLLNLLNRFLKGPLHHVAVIKFSLSTTIFPNSTSASLNSSSAKSSSLISSLSSHACSQATLSSSLSSQ